MKYRIPFGYERYGFLFVEAGSVRDAYEKAEEKIHGMSESEMMEMTSYLEDSENIDYEGAVYDGDGNIVHNGI